MAYVTKINGYDIKDSEARGDVSTLQESMGTAQGNIETLQGDLSDTKADLGDITTLDTTDKTSAVGAINEVNIAISDETTARENADGDLTQLATTTKTSLVGAINEIDAKTLKMTSTTWSELKALRDNGNLVRGMQYRITDFVTTTVQADTQSAGHAFDIIVTADSESVLNENARAAIHADDTYFADSKLNAWKLKYCLDNDTNRFVWADTTNGKGVIYRMIDEFENDLPYDFKNIQFKRYKADGKVYILSDADSKYTAIRNILTSLLGSSVTTSNMPFWYSYFDSTTVSGNWTDQNGNTVDGSTLGNVNNILHEPPSLVLGMSSDYKWFYTFSKFSSVTSEAEDSSLLNSVYKNKFGWGTKSGNTVSLGENVFIGNSFYSNTIGNSFNSNTIGNSFYSNTIGNSFNSNTIGNSFNFSMVGNSFNSNTIGNSFYSNTIGNSFYSNTVGNSFNFNTIGNSFYSNTIGNSFYSNTIGNSFYSNTIGNSFNSNTIGNSFYSNTVGNYYKWIHAEDGCQNLRFTVNGTSSSYVQKYRVLAGTAPTSAQTVSVTAGNAVPYNVKQTGTSTISVEAA